MKKVDIPMRYCIMCNNLINRRTKCGKRTSPKQYVKSLFCSNKCRGEWLSLNNVGKNNFNYRGGKTICIDCGKMLNYRYSYCDTNRCRKCWIKLDKTGTNSHLWKNGKYTDKNGYIYTHKPNHPSRNNNCYIFEHRLVAEKCLGRYLTKKEVMHHINGIRNDNRPENLYLFASNNEHRKFEGKCLNTRRNETVKDKLPFLKSNII